MNDIQKSIDYFEKKLQQGVSKCRRRYYKTVISAMQELQQYRQIGTLEECREAVENQKAKKPEFDKPLMILGCPSCGYYLQKVIDDDSTEGFIPNYCSNCGQKIDSCWNIKESENSHWKENFLNRFERRT